MKPKICLVLDDETLPAIDDLEVAMQRAEAHIEDGHRCWIGIYSGDKAAPMAVLRWDPVFRSWSTS